MSTPRLTEERLRTWVVSQPDRERMCLGILASDSRFVDVRPRRPKGGRDGSRDIELTCDGHTVWGAVGFRNNATDSKEDKKWVVDKFSEDLDAALKENPSLWGFVFLTNIDLTPSEVTNLSRSLQNAAVSPLLRSFTVNALESPLIAQPV